MKKAICIPLCIMLCSSFLLLCKKKSPKDDKKVIISWTEKSGLQKAPPVGNINVPFYTPKIQMRKKHIASVVRIIKQFPKCKLLIWGLGFDSKLWCSVNKNGTTIFIEDSPYWAKKISKEIACKVVLVKYNSKLRNAMKLLKNPKALHLKMPKKILNTKFDVIVVDAPNGYNNDAPGRMKSIFMSSKLIHKNSHVFVDDYKRKVESTFANTFLKPIFGEPTVYTERLHFAHFGKRNK